MGKGRYITIATVAHTGRNQMRLRVPAREEIKNDEYGKLLKANMVSRTERQKIGTKKNILQWLPFPVLEEIKHAYGFPFTSHFHV